MKGSLDMYYMGRGNKVIGELIIILVGNKNVILLVFSELFIKRVIDFEE